MSNGNVNLKLGLDTSGASAELAAFYKKLNSDAGAAARMNEPLETAMSKLVESARRVGMTWDATAQKFRDSKGATRGIEEVQQRLKELEENTRKAAAATETMKAVLASGFQNALQGIPQGIGQALGTQLLAPFRAVQEVVGQSAGTFINLDEALRQTLAAAGESNGRFGELSDSVTRLASSSAFSAKEIAGVTTELARAGFTIDDVAKALPGIDAAANASGEGLAEATQNIITSLGGFQLGADQAGRVADVLTVAANAAAQSTSDVGEAFKYTAPIAKALGLTLEDTAGATILLANAGIKGSQAGTALRTGLGRLAATAAAGSSEFAELSRGTGRLGQVAQKLALSLSDVKGNLLPLPELIRNLKQGTDGLASTEKALVLKLLFGDEAGSSWVSLLNNNTEAITKAFAATNNATGAATRTAAQNLSGISGALKLLQGAIGGFQASVGNVISAALLPFVQAATQIVGVWNQLPGPLKTAGTVLVGLTAAAATATVAVLAFNAAMKTELVLGMVAGLRALAAGFSIQAATAKAAAGVQAVTTTLAGLSSALQAPISAGPALAALWASITAGVRGLAASLSSQNLAAMWAAISQGATNAAISIRAFLVAMAPFAAVAIAIGAVVAVWNTWDSVMRKGDQAQDKASEGIKNLQAEMAKLGASVADGSTAWDRSVERVGVFQAALDRLRGAAGLTTSEQASLQQEAVKTADGVQRVTVATDSATEAYRKAAAAAGEDAAANERADQMRQQIVRTLDGQIGSLQAQKAALDGLKKTKGSLTEDEANLLRTVDAGLRTMEAQKVLLNAIAKAHLGAAAAADTQTQSVKDLGAALDQEKAQFQNALSAIDESFKNFKDQKEQAFAADNLPIKEKIEATGKEIENVREGSRKAGEAMAEAGRIAAEKYDKATEASKRTAAAQVEVAAAATKASAALVQSKIDATRAAMDNQGRDDSAMVAAIGRQAAAAAASADKRIQAAQAAAAAQSKAAQVADRAAQAATAAEQKKAAAAEQAIQRAERAEDTRHKEEMAHLQESAAAIQKNGDERLAALAEATPAERKLGALERARLQQQTLLGGEEGLRAQAQMERADREAQSAQVKLQTEQQLANVRASAEEAAKRKDEEDARREAAREQRQAEAEKRAEAAAAAQEQRQQEAERRQQESQDRIAQMEATRQAQAEAFDRRKAAAEAAAATRRAEYEAKIKKLEEEKEKAGEQIAAKVEQRKDDSAKKDQERDDKEKERKAALEKAQREEKEKTATKIKGLEQGLADLKKTLTNQEKRQKAELADAEKQLADRKVDLQKRYQSALGEVNRYIVQGGSVAWTNYANQAVEQLKRVQAAAAAAARAATGSGGSGGNRAMGGPVTGGQTYTVNELAQESFMDRRGNLSLITAPMFGTWRPPTDGTVIPGGLTASLRAQGAFEAVQATTTAASSDGGILGRLAAGLGGGDSIGRVTNNVTIQSQEPVSDASRMMVEMTRFRVRRR